MLIQKGRGLTMRPFFTLLFILFSSSAMAQTWAYQITEMRGMEDWQGHTHLFYRHHTASSGPDYNYSRDDFYHFDLHAGVDTLFLEDYYRDNPLYTEGVTINDFDFWDQDPAKYIFCGYGTSYDNTGFIERYDIGPVYSELGEVTMVEIAPQNDSLIFANLQGKTIVSHDGGHTWENFNSEFLFIAISPFADSVLYGIDWHKRLVRSEDMGVTFQVVDTTIPWGVSSNETTLLFDPDSQHVYGATEFFIPIHHYYYLMRSDDGGFHWDSLMSFPESFLIINDTRTSGLLYMAMNMDTVVYFSNDYGDHFSPLLTFSEPVTGLYKKPGTDTLYIATTHALHEYAGGQLKTVLQVPVLIDAPSDVMEDFRLYPAFPNPFNSQTHFRFQLDRPARVWIRIYTINGQLVRTLLDGKTLTSGFHRVSWDGRNRAGNPAASGIYLCQFHTPRFQRTIRVVLMR